MNGTKDRQQEQRLGVVMVGLVPGTVALVQWHGQREAIVHRSGRFWDLAPVVAIASSSTFRSARRAY